MTKAAALARQLTERAAKISGEQPGKHEWYRHADARLDNAAATLLASQEAEIAELRGALDAIEEIPDYSVSDYEKIRLILFAVKRARAALRPAETGDGQP